MAVIDRINRRGTHDRHVIVGPGELVGPVSGETKSDGTTLSGFYGSVDRYEITDGAGTNAGSYTVAMRPYSEDGFTPRHRAVGDVAVLHQAGGIANPLGAIICLGRRKPLRETDPVVLGPFSVSAGDRLWVVVEYKDYSTLKYQLEVDFSV